MFRYFRVTTLVRVDPTGSVVSSHSSLGIKVAVSVLEIFKVGIGPSSSHTVGPMRAARMFTLALAEQGVMTSVTRVLSEMFGSLGATGKGHGTDSAVLLGLSGHEPDTVDVDQVPAILEGIRVVSH